MLHACKTVQKRPHWQNDDYVQKSKFSPHQLQNFCLRKTIRRRKITRVLPKHGPDAEVNKIFKIGQDKFDTGNYIGVGNGDETALCMGAQPC